MDNFIIALTSDTHTNKRKIENLLKWTAWAAREMIQDNIDLMLLYEQEKSGNY